LSFFLRLPTTTEIYTLSLHDALPISEHPLAVRVGKAAHHEAQLVRKLLIQRCLIVQVDVFMIVGIVRDKGRHFIDELGPVGEVRSEEHTSELQSRFDLVCRLLLEKKK